MRSLFCRVYIEACVGLAALAMSVSVSGCGFGRAEAESGEPAAASAEAVAGLRDDALLMRRHDLVQRLKRPLDMPAKLERQQCPDAELDVRDELAQKLVRDVQDARVEARQLLPLSLVQKLASREWEALQLEDEWGNERALGGAEGEEDLARRLELVERRRYKAVYHVTHYVHPKLIRRIDRPKSEWIPGHLSGWLVVYALESGQALCQVDVVANTDVSDAPISYRKRSATRDALVEALGNEWRERAAQALGQISATLTLD